MLFSSSFIFQRLIIVVPVSQRNVLQMREKDLQVV